MKIKQSKTNSVKNEINLTIQTLQNSITQNQQIPTNIFTLVLRMKPGSHIKVHVSVLLIKMQSQNQRDRTFEQSQRLHLLWKLQSERQKQKIGDRGSILLAAVTRNSCLCVPVILGCTFTDGYCNLKSIKFSLRCGQVRCELFFLFKITSFSVSLILFKYL